MSLYALSLLAFTIRQTVALLTPSKPFTTGNRTIAILGYESASVNAELIVCLFKVHLILISFAWLHAVAYEVIFI